MLFLSFESIALVNLILGTSQSVLFFVEDVNAEVAKGNEKWIEASES